MTGRSRSPSAIDAQSHGSKAIAYDAPKNEIPFGRNSGGTRMVQNFPRDRMCLEIRELVRIYLTHMFLTTDGEKPDRHRDQEFEIDPGTSRSEVMEWWEQGWKSVFDAITPLKPEDLRRAVLIAGLEHTVMQAITRQLLHYAGHVNQIVLLAKHFCRPEWKSLSIPKGQSETYARQFEQKRAEALAGKE